LIRHFDLQYREFFIPGLPVMSACPFPILDKVRRAYLCQLRVVNLDPRLNVDRELLDGREQAYSEALRFIRHPSKYADNAAKAGSAASKATKVL
jgi:hypothetical protein